MEKIVTSQNQDMGLAINELNKALSDVDFLQTHLASMEILARKQAEEIAALNNRYKGLKRVRIGCLCIAGTGLIVGATGYFVHKSDSSEELGKMLMYAGATALGCSAATFGLSFSIPF
jgi:hypothetical protein